MSGRCPGLSSATSTESSAVPTSMASGSSASVIACAKFGGILASGDPRSDLEDSVGDHRDDRTRPDAEQQHGGDERDEHRQIQKRDVAHPGELVANRSEEDPVGDPQESPGGHDHA